MNDSDFLNAVPVEVITWGADGPVSSGSAQKSHPESNTTLPGSLPFPLTEPYLHSEPSGDSEPPKPFIWDKGVFYKKHARFIGRVCKGLKLLGNLYYVDKDHRVNGGERGDVILRRFFKAVANPESKYPALSRHPTRECVAVEDVEKLFRAFRQDLADATTILIRRHRTTSRFYANIHGASGAIGTFGGEFLDDYAKMHDRLNVKISENITPTPARAAIAKRNKLLGLPLRLY